MVTVVKESPLRILILGFVVLLIILVLLGGFLFTRLRNSKKSVAENTTHPTSNAKVTIVTPTPIPHQSLLPIIPEQPTPSPTVTYPAAHTNPHLSNTPIANLQPGGKNDHPNVYSYHSYPSQWVITTTRRTYRTETIEEEDNTTDMSTQASTIEEENQASTEANNGSGYAGTYSSATSD